MKRYNLINNVMGWACFAVAAFTYIMTAESTASFWDCGEFISTADKLLVGHPPGAPLFMIIARFFAILAPTTELVAFFINVMSALASAFTILFLFWTTTHLARKIIIDNAETADGEPETWRTWAVMAAGTVGALAYTFSDTFWFSAVEGEVYGMSSFFTAIVFWCILKWENVADQPGANRWIVLIAYLMGLSIGVHLLNLLCIPAIALVYYYRLYKPTTKGTCVALGISCAVLGAILYGIIPGLVKIAGYFELACVNGMGLPYNSGALLWLLLLTAGIIWGIYYTWTHGRALANTIVTSVAVIILGYSSFAMVVIRSASDPTMDQNSPDNVFALIDYLNREQYGDRPLFYGQTFASPCVAQEEGDPIYVQRNDKYEAVDHKMKYIFSGNVLLPRMYSSSANHVTQYKAWTNFKGTNASVDDGQGGKTTIRIPTFGENLKFLFSYQINFMYLRYFMWNFSGRQNDIQGHGELTHGNWITGIPFIDNMMLGDQDLLPESLKNNKGHNTYFMLPLILGLLGLFWQAGKGAVGKQGFWIVMLLFFMTGLAIVLYLNQTPLQPRERDYAYAGSFYAFAIWIGLGVLQLIEWLSKALPKQRVIATAVAGVLSLVAVPGLMAQQNWDDHDRSGSTVARDIAYNYLNSCDENAIIFTNGDNDTFPLWYAQEVEGIRTDVRVCNLSYLQTDWYCDQMKRQAYESTPVPISFTHEQYSHDRDVIYLFGQREAPQDLGQALAFIHSDDPRAKYRTNGGEALRYLPGKSFVMPVDKAKALSSGTVRAERANELVDTIRFGVSANHLLKNHLMVIDMLYNANWERPIYYAVTVGRDNYIGLDRYFQLEGLAYRIAPIESKGDRLGNEGTVDTERMYDNVMNKFRWGLFNKPGMYVDENKTRMATNLRNNMTRLASALIDEVISNDSIMAQFSDSTLEETPEQVARAIKVIDKAAVEFPADVIPHTYLSLELAENCYRAGLLADAATKDRLDTMGDEIIKSFADENRKELEYYLSLDQGKMNACFESIRRCGTIYYAILNTCQHTRRSELQKTIEAEHESVNAVLQAMSQGY